jgi:hypothetical protein
VHHQNRFGGNIRILAMNFPLDRVRHGDHLRGARETGSLDPGREVEFCPARAGLQVCE